MEQDTGSVLLIEGIPGKVRSFIDDHQNAFVRPGGQPLGHYRFGRYGIDDDRNADACGRIKAGEVRDPADIRRFWPKHLAYSRQRRVLSLKAIS